MLGCKPGSNDVQLQGRPSRLSTAIKAVQTSSTLLRFRPESDIELRLTYLLTTFRGNWLYLYLLSDVSSRRALAWDVDEFEELAITMHLVSRAFPGPPKSVSMACWRGLTALALVGGNGSPPCPKSLTQQLISLIPAI